MAWPGLEDSPDEVASDSVHCRDLAEAVGLQPDLQFAGSEKLRLRAVEPRSQKARGDARVMNRVELVKHNPARSSENAMSLPECRSGIAHMVERDHTDDDIERFLDKRQRLCLSLDEVKPGVQRATEADLASIRLKHDDLAASTREPRGRAPGATAEIQQPGVRVRGNELAQSREITRPFADAQGFLDPKPWSEVHFLERRLRERHGGDRYPAGASAIM